MSRYSFQSHFKDGNGKVVGDGTISVFLAGTSTAASIYTASSGGSPVNSVTSNSTTGHFIFYVDTSDYNRDQKFKIILSKTNYQSQTYDDLSIPGFSDATYTYYADAAAADQGVDSNDNSVANILAEIGTTNKRTILFKPGTYTWSTNDTITSNIHVEIQAGAIFSIDSGKTLTISGTINAPEMKIFDGSGSIVFGSTFTAKVYPEWWGALGDGSTDDYTEINNAISSLPTGGGSIFLNPIVYKISSTLTLGNNQHIYGPGATISATMTSGEAIKFLSAGWASINLYNIIYTGTTGGGESTTGLTYDGSQYCRADVFKINDFPGNGIKYTGVGSTQNCSDNYSNINQITDCDGGILLESKNVAGDKVVEGNTIIFNLCINHTTFCVRVGDDLSQNSCQLNRLIGFAHATGNYPAVDFKNNANLYFGGAERDTGTPSVIFGTSADNLVLSGSASFESSGTNLVFSNDILDITGFRFADEAGALVIRDKSTDDDTKLFTWSSDILDVLSGTDMVSGARLRMWRDIDMTTGTRIRLSNSQTTVGAAGGATALPANPTGYLPIKVGATEYVIPYYAKS